MEALAAQAGVATSTVYRIETGRVEPSSGALVRIASVLGVAIDDLIVHADEITGTSQTVPEVAENTKTPRPLTAVRGAS